jgi:hypothetical protein
MPETATEIPVVTAAPVTTETPAVVTPPSATPEPVKLNDPFSDLATVLKKADEPKAEPKEGKDAKTAPKTDAPKTVATRKNPLEEQRTRIEQQNATIAQTAKERDELKQEIARLRNSGDTTALMASVQELKKKNEQLNGEIAARDYSKHPEFQAKYEKPFTDAANSAKKIVDSLEITNAEGESRLAKWETDFAPIYQLPRPAARARAKELFGEDAVSVMAQYDKLHELQDSKEQALTDWQTGATEREQKQRAESLVRQQNIEQAFDLVTKNYMENDSEFQIKPDDKETKALWDKSQAIVDKSYFGRDKLAPHELIMLDAAVRLRAINEPVLRAKLAKITEELNDYKARLEEKETSKSGSTRRASPPPETAEKPEFFGDLKKSLQDAGG